MDDKEKIFTDRNINSLINRPIYVFGRDITQIPCFRNSFLYGICSGIGAGLCYFMFTSQIRKATHFGFGSYMLVTLGYWFHCRYQYSVTKMQYAQINKAMQERLLNEGTSRDPNRIFSDSGTDV